MALDLQQRATRHGPCPHHTRHETENSRMNSTPEPDKKWGDYRAICDGSPGARKIAMWFNPIEFTGLDQERDAGPVLCARIVTCEEPVFTVDGDGTNVALDGIVVELDVTIAPKQA
jgi:hypothetical protein